MQFQVCKFVSLKISFFAIATISGKGGSCYAFLTNCQLHSCLYAKERSNGTMRIVWFMVGILMSLKKLGHPQNQFSCRWWKDNYLGLMSLLLQCFWLPWGLGV